MAKPGLDVARVVATSTIGSPITYDSGYYYDDPDLYYDRWVTDSDDPAQGEIPTISVAKENIQNDLKTEDVKIEVEEL